MSERVRRRGRRRRGMMRMRRRRRRRERGGTALSGSHAGGPAGDPTFHDFEGHSKVIDF